MKKLLLGIGLGGMLLVSSPAWSDDSATPPAAAPSTATVVAASTTPAVAPSTATLSTPAAPAAVTTAAPAAAAAPVDKVDTGDDAYMIISSAFVILMSVPGLALFYGGLVRKKNMLSVLMQVFTIFSLITVLWVVYGYSIAFTQGHNALSPFFGSLDNIFMKGITPDTVAATFSKNVGIHEYVYVVFQGAFAAITCCLIIGSLAERVKFSGLLVFIVLWFTFAYLPVAHMVWFWQGPDAYTSAKASDAANATAGWLFQKGAIDFAGGTVVHINSAIAGLVGAFVVGKRVGLGREIMAPHSTTMTMIGASLLWFGWFGFNAGSALQASTSGLPFINTWLATAAAALSWSGAEWALKGKPSMLGGASGAVAGLVAITPACGYVGVMGALVIRYIAGVICLWGVHGLKKILGADDALDVFGVHGVGGMLGAILTGVFCSPALGGVGIYDYVANNTPATYDMLGQVKSQLWAIGTTLVWSGLVSLLAYKIADVVVGLRVTEEDERMGLDVSTHGEQAYND